MSIIQDYALNNKMTISNRSVRWLKLKEIDTNEWLKEDFIIKCDSKIVNLTPKQINIINNKDFKSKLEILRIDEQFYWSKLIDSTYIPHNATRIGYDNTINNFVYIGRIQQNNGQKYLIGTVSNYCEYIPAIAIKLSSSIDSLDDAKENEQIAHLNYSTTNYEILCIKYQPVKLQSLCIKNFLELEFKNPNNRKMHFEHRLPSGLHKYIWPAKLILDDSLQKLAKLCSPNLKYEISIGKTGIMKFDRFNDDNSIEATFIYEKDIECLLLCKNGVFLLFDYKQAYRRPILLHEFTCPNKIFYSIYLKLTNNGKLMLIKRGKDLTIKFCLINLDDYLANYENNKVSIELKHKKMIETNHAFEIKTINESDRAKYQLIRMFLLEDFKIYHIPIIIFNLIVIIIKKVLNKIFCISN